MFYTHAHTHSHTHTPTYWVWCRPLCPQNVLYIHKHTHTHSYILGIVEVSVSSAWRNSISWAVLDPGAAHMSRTCKERSQLKL